MKKDPLGACVLVGTLIVSGEVAGAASGAPVNIYQCPGGRILLGDNANTVGELLSDHMVPCTREDCDGADIQLRELAEKVGLRVSGSELVMETGTGNFADGIKEFLRRLGGIRKMVDRNPKHKKEV